MLLLITLMYVSAEKKKLQLNSASLRSRNFYHWGYFNWGGAGPPGPPPLATPMPLTTFDLAKALRLPTRRALYVSCLVAPVYSERRLIDMLLINFFLLGFKPPFSSSSSLFIDATK